MFDPALEAAMRLPRFPLSAKYDLAWMVENEMGPSSLWLAEFLLDAMDLKPGMKVLDLGCGKAMSSIFLARERGVRVWATDLWIDASSNHERVKAMGAEDLVCPIHAEAHELPFARGFFDAIVSLDSYHYYGTDDLYLNYISAFLKPGGRLGIVVPGVERELTRRDALGLAPWWEDEFYTFHSPAWWREHWERWSSVQVESSDAMSDGYRTWLHWDKTLKEAGVLKRNGDVELLERAGGNFTFCRIVALKR